MNHPDSDLLRKAASALRTQRTGHAAGSGFTRARILNDLRTQRKKRNRWWRLGLPVGVLLAGTTAWASASGKWPAVWVSVSTLLNLPLTDNGVSERERAALEKPKSVGGRGNPLDAMQPTADLLPAPPSADPAAELSPPEPHLDAPVAAPMAAATADDAPAANPPPPSASHRSQATAMVPPRRAPRPPPVDSAPESVARPTSETAAPRAPELELEIREFRLADDLYRRDRDWGAAVSAYRRYVNAYPAGRFVPEAKYNMALSLLKLGRSSEARSLLEGFASGAYGNYRRDSAQQLLDALNK